MQGDAQKESYRIWLEQRGLARPLLRPSRNHGHAPIAAVPSAPSLHSFVLFLSDSEFWQGASAQHQQEHDLFLKIIAALNLGPGDWQLHLVGTHGSAAAPEKLIVLGEAAAAQVWGRNLSIDQWRSEPQVTVIGSQPVAAHVTYHPRDLLRDAQLKRHVWNDLKPHLLRDARSHA